MQFRRMYTRNPDLLSYRMINGSESLIYGLLAIGIGSIVLSPLLDSKAINFGNWSKLVLKFEVIGLLATLGCIIKFFELLTLNLDRKTGTITHDRRVLGLQLGSTVQAYLRGFDRVVLIRKDYGGIPPDFLVKLRGCDEAEFWLCTIANEVKAVTLGAEVAEFLGYEFENRVTEKDAK